MDILRAKWQFKLYFSDNHRMLGSWRLAIPLCSKTCWVPTYCWRIGRCMRNRPCRHCGSKRRCVFLGKRLFRVVGYRKRRRLLYSTGGNAMNCKLSFPISCCKYTISLSHSKKSLCLLGEAQYWRCIHCQCTMQWGGDYFDGRHWNTLRVWGKQWK